MRRREFLQGCLSFMVFFSLTNWAFAANRKFVFKIKTKSGGIIGNVVIEAKDIEVAKYKLRKRYPDCEILEGSEK